MIPNVLNLEQQDTLSDFQVQPSLTYRLDFTNNRIIGKIDDKDAIFQFIQKVLNTDKYAYEIYDWYYGQELKNLTGQPYDYIIVEIPRIINQALLVDDRIFEVTDFVFNRNSIDSMECSFTVVTIYGKISYGLGVSI